MEFLFELGELSITSGVEIERLRLRSEGCQVLITFFNDLDNLPKILVPHSLTTRLRYF